VTGESENPYESPAPMPVRGRPAPATGPGWVEPYKDRSVGLAVFGVLLMVMGGLCALAVPLMIVGLVMAMMGPGPRRVSPSAAWSPGSCSMWWPPRS